METNAPRKWIPAQLRPYVLHTRPRSWAIVAAHMSVGFLLAVHLQIDGERIVQWLLAMLAWAVLGNGGTLAINSAYDRDEGDIGYLENPPPVPRYLARFALLWMLAGFAPAAVLGWRFLLAYLLCFLMSLAYSVPPLRCKARAGLDLLINSVGYGALTIYAGWAAAARPLEAPILNVAAAFGCFFIGFYPLTQIYQMEEDARRGDKTLALMLGKTSALWVGMLGTAGGFALLTREAIQRTYSLPLLLLIPAAAWLWALLPWYFSRHRVSVCWEQRRFYHALTAWALTDLMTLLVFAERG